VEALTGMRCGSCGAVGSEHWALATDVEYRTSSAEWEYRRCESCGVIFLADPPVDRLSEIYPPNYYSYRADGERSVLQRLKERVDRRMLRRFLAPIPGERLRVMDVGGGTGSLATTARSADRRVHDTVVVDLDPACAEAAEGAGHRYVLGSVDEVELGDVDAVLLFNLIEHVAHPVATLQRLAAALRPGGRILVKTPNTASWDARLFRHTSWGGYHCPRHWVLYAPDSFRAAVARAGLAVASLQVTQGAPFWAVSWFHALERRRLLRRPDGQAMVQHRAFPLLLSAGVALDLARRPFAPTSQMFATLVRADAPAG
jgi:2-polyprenyl-3-methyl-5-hydroxy-6-metoxy-1,4-benzoquinol methylase